MLNKMQKKMLAVSLVPYLAYTVANTVGVYCCSNSDIRLGMIISWTTMSVAMILFFTFFREMKR